MQDASLLANFVFHVYNRSNDRSTLFNTDENYQIFLLKMIRQLETAVHLLGYCIMPNHFHLLVIPKHTIREDFPLDGEQYNLMPTLEFSEAMRRLLMGYTKSYNKFYDLAGSRFQQRSKAKHHKGGIRNGLDYLHENPTKAKLVDHPSEWGFSSYNEYSGLIDPSDCICDVALGRALLAL
jgi:REP element-mobilizing transposase RayT